MSQFYSAKNKMGVSQFLSGIHLMVPGNPTRAERAQETLSDMHLITVLTQACLTFRVRIRVL